MNQKIDAKDLVVGSYVLDEQHRLIEIGSVVTKHKVIGYTVLGERVSADIQDLSPILLTSEWLQRFGFQINSSWNWKVANTDYSIFEGALGYFCLNKTGQANGCTLTSVHQLQALIWQMERTWLSIEQKGGQG